MGDLVDHAQAREQEIIDEAIARQAAATPRGPSRMDCIDCGDPIPAERRKAVPGCKRCVHCEEYNERRARAR